MKHGPRLRLPCTCGPALLVLALLVAVLVLAALLAPVPGLLVVVLPLLLTLAASTILGARLLPVTALYRLRKTPSFPARFGRPPPAPASR